MNQKLFDIIVNNNVDKTVDWLNKIDFNTAQRNATLKTTYRF